ncbi:MAG: FG-GAP repeat domain-containing protein [Phycisphaerae bacterium]
MTVVTPDPNESLSLQKGESGWPSVGPFPPGDPDLNLRGGWPVDLGLNGSGYPYTPTLYDADGDGADEIFLTGGHTFALRGDGTFLPGWPTTEMEYMGYGTNGNKPGPSAADFDGDGEGEVLWSLRDWYAGSSVMWSFNVKNLDGTDLPGFPQHAPDMTWNSNALDTPFVIGDTDGDGDLEAWAPHTLGNNFTYYRVSAFDQTGTRLFTVDLNDEESVVSLYFGDLDGDGTKKMFAVSWLSPSLWLHVFQADGSEASGYPIVLHTLGSGWLMFGPPVPADLDDDGDLEILLGHWGGGASYAQCYHHDGTPCAGFPIQIATSSQLFYLGLGDVTGDGEPELLATDNHLGADYRVYAIDLASGTTLPGWPYGVTSWPKGFPAVVDVDNDAVQDVCFATGSGELFAVSGQGQLIDGYPKLMASPSISGVAAGDIDGDGLFELVAATWDGWVYAWDTTGAALPGRADWPMRGVNARNTGVFGDQAWIVGDLDGDCDVDLSDLAVLLSNYGTTGGASYEDGDLDGDGDVDLTDLAELLSVYGTICP